MQVDLTQLDSQNPDHPVKPASRLHKKAAKAELFEFDSKGYKKVQTMYEAKMVEQEVPIPHKPSLLRSVRVGAIVSDPIGPSCLAIMPDPIGSLSLTPFGPSSLTPSGYRPIVPDPIGPSCLTPSGHHPWPHQAIGPSSPTPSAHRAQPPAHHP